jgi:DNA-binding NtrC family response regulator
MTKFMTLLVEDDVFQREVLAEVLKDEGFEVVECSTAEAAELIIATSGTELRAVITDQNLEGEMLGSELASFARRKFPELNIILMSGQQTPRLHQEICFLQKPFCRTSCSRRSGSATEACSWVKQI